MSGLARLREVAEAATPGPWEAWRQANSSYVDAAPRDPDPSASDPVCEVATEPDAVHIATFDPATVLALLDVAETADGLLTHYHDDFQGAFTSMQAALDRLREVAS